MFLTVPIDFLRSPSGRSLGRDGVLLWIHLRSIAIEQKTEYLGPDHTREYLSSDLSLLGVKASSIPALLQLGNTLGLWHWKEGWGVYLWDLRSGSPGLKDWQIDRDASALQSLGLTVETMGSGRTQFLSYSRHELTKSPNGARIQDLSCNVLECPDLSGQTKTSQDSRAPGTGTERNGTERNGTELPTPQPPPSRAGDTLAKPPAFQHLPSTPPEMREQEETPGGPTVEQALESLRSRWNAMAKACPGIVVRQVPLSGQPRLMAKARMSDATWRVRAAQALQLIPQSDEYRGQNRSGWRASLEWFVRPETVNGILDKFGVIPATPEGAQS